MNNVDNMEKEANYKIIMMEEETSKDDLRKDIRQDFNQLYKDVCDWCKEKLEREEVNDRLNKLTLDTAILFDKGTHKLKTFMQADEVQKAKAMAVDIGEHVKDSLDNGLHSVKEKEIVTTCGDAIQQSIQQIKANEHLQMAVHKAKRGTSQLAKSAVQSIKHVFDQNEDND